MAKVQTPHKKVVKSPAKNNQNSQSSQKTQTDYCILCRKFHLKHEAQQHVHSMLHHRELDIVLGKDSRHECQACKSSSMGLNEYAKHISTAEHIAKLKSLINKNVKALSLHKTLGKETVCQILERNKTLKKEEKKATKKKKKKQKQIAGQKRAAMLQGAGSKNKVVSKVVKVKQDKQTNISTLKQDNYQQGRNNAVVQNKENKVSRLQRPLHQRESSLQNQSGKLACLSGEPAGQTSHCPDVRDQSTQSAHHFSIKIESSQTDSLGRKQQKGQGGAAKIPGKAWPTMSQNDYYNKQYDGDFTSDQLPHNGAIIFGHGQSDSTGSSLPGQEALAQRAAASRSTNAVPIRDVDVSAMLRQIRRALGVREPCRADREARKQNSEASVRGAEKEQVASGYFRNNTKEATHPITYAAATSVQSSQVNSSAAASHSSVCPSSIAPPNPKQMKSDIRERVSQGALNSQISVSRCSTTSSEYNSNITRKIRIAHSSAKAQGGNEAGLTPKLDKMFSLSGSNRKMSWRELYEETKRERGKGMPRFGIEMANPLSDQESSRKAEYDITLSEGFHWESFPDTTSGAQWIGLPPLPQDTIHNDSHTEMQSNSQMQEPVEQPGAAQEGCSSQTTEAVSVKLEQYLENDDGDLRASGGASKRKHNVCGDISDQQPCGKKMKSKSNPDQCQMDQLLAVSLREDELSHTLQDLDKSLVQARNALQAAYAEVQRLMLMIQQFTAEVNSLRAQRIEILQGMKGGYSGASNVTEKAAISPARAGVSPLPSSSAFPTQSCPTIPASSISPLALPAMQVKLENVQQFTDGQFPKTLSCNSDTLQVPVNKPVPLFSSELLPSLLLPSPSLAAPTAAVTSLTQPQTECSTSPFRNPQTVTVAREEAQSADADSVKAAGENLCIVKEKEPAAEKPVSTFVPERDQNASAAAPDDDKGNESDSSVKMVEASNVVVIDIDDSEETPNDPVQQEPPEKAVSVELNSFSTQLVQQNEAERKLQPTLAPVKDASVPPEGVEDDEPSVGAFSNHAGLVQGLQVHEGRLYTCSGDNTARAYSLMNRECQAVFEGHTDKVNCLLVSSVPNLPARLYTGSSDQTIRCYSIKTTKFLEQISLSDRVLCLHSAWNILFAGLANGSVASYDLKTLKQLDVFECHGPRGVSCLGTAQEGARRVLLVGSYDSTISVRDAKSGLLLRSLKGHTKTVLCMKVVNDLVFSGSSDTSVHAHNIHTGELVRIYKGHGHAVTSIVILGKVMVTACLDQLVRVYELKSHDLLQVYGGHSDMVICMAVHKSVVYTGCYDGSVQAVKLNLLNNYRCWWQNCPLIFGMAEHLLQHLVHDHTNSNLQSVKCRWRGCSTFFMTQQCVRQKLPEHMQSHVDNDSKVQP
ncbi:zinc finger protein 106 isoform X2 [Plectropomus leopardus]|nr:zinc finger protein 106 isoform X2 [Plectropomus leopardus]